MKGTVYGNRLPMGYASEKSLGTTALDCTENRRQHHTPKRRGTAKPHGVTFQKTVIYGFAC
jgi:hypothetical protein